MDNNLSDILKDIEDIVSGLTDSTHEEPLTTGPVEVFVGGNWMPTTLEDWSAWTGLRRVWGIEYHGPVSYKDKKDKLYTGPRGCPCETCQETVEPRFKMN